VLRNGQVAPRALRRELIEKIRAGALDDAGTACDYRSCPLSAVAAAGIEYIRTVPQTDAMILRDVMEGEGGRQSEAIQGQTQYLLDIAVVAPMVGLLGTVFGMLRAFSSVALDIAKAKPVVLAGGVSQALITTAFGLIVGIPAMIFFAYFRRRASKVVSHLEAASADVLTALLSRGEQ
jgi:biopolymer transport protein ExbB